jgi:MscS family membrane protein
MEELFELFSGWIPWLNETVLDMPVWGWIGIPLILMVALLAGQLISQTIINILHFGYTRIGHDKSVIIFQQMKAPLALFLGALIFSAASRLLPLEDKIDAFINGITMTMAVFAATWAGLRLISTEGNRLRLYFNQHEKPGASALIPLLSKLAKAAIIVIAALFLLQNFGFDVIAILTTLGIGGIAVALASQRSVENIFGGAMIGLDQPVRIGDFCKWNGQVGTIEDIGLRSTKIRTLDRTIVSVPNSEMASIQLENYARRDKILLLTTIRLRYETTPEQLRQIVMGIRKLLLENPKIENEPARARFVAFNEFSLDIEIFAYARTANWDEFLEVREEIYLRIMEIVYQAGSNFAIPSQTIYLKRSAKSSAELGADDKKQRINVVDQRKYASSNNQLKSSGLT